MKRKYSLKRNQDIEKVVKSKNSVGNRYYTIYYLPNNLKKPQIALSVSKKFGNAVNRNYEKRVIRAILRNKIQKLPNYSFLIVIKKPASQLKYNEKELQINYLFSLIFKREKGDKHEKK